MKTRQFESKLDEVDHWTPESHWCADCWQWVVDCEHLVDPLANEHTAVEDGWIRSLAYDRGTRCLGVRFKWCAVHQYRLVSLDVMRAIWKARPMNTALQELVMKSRRILKRSEVRGNCRCRYCTGSDPSVTDYILEDPAKCVLHR